MLPIALSLAGCKVSELTATHDTVFRDRVRTETLYSIDSVYVDRWHTVRTSGDTVYRIDSLVRTRVLTVKDTVRMTDTLYISRSEKQAVVKERKRWPIGVIGIIGVLGVIGVIGIIRLIGLVRK